MNLAYFDLRTLKFLIVNARPLQRPNPPPALVELFALPGSGKTTIVEAVAEHAVVTTRKKLSAEWARSSAIEQIGYVSRAFGSRSRLATAMRFGLGARIATPESVFRLIRLLAKTHWLRSQSGLMLLDQGFLQDLWSILVSGKSDRCDPMLLAPLIRALYEGIEVRIIVIEVDAETASARIGGRTHGGSRLDGLPEEELRISLASASGVQHQIIDAAKLAGLPVQALDGSAPPNILVDQLLSLLPEDDGRNNVRSGQRPRRISIVGSTGSGKTYFAKELAAHLSLPAYALDDVRDAAKQPLSEHIFQEVVAELTGGDEWIIDGHYRDVRHLIWSRADLVIWLNYPLPIVATRLLSRFRRKRRYFTEHPGMTSKRVHPESERAASWGTRFRRIARTLRERREYGRVLRSPECRNLRIVELTSTRMARQWLQNL